MDAAWTHDMPHVRTRRVLALAAGDRRTLTSSCASMHTNVRAREGARAHGCMQARLTVEVLRPVQEARGESGDSIAPDKTTNEQLAEEPHVPEHPLPLPCFLDSPCARRERRCRTTALGVHLTRDKEKLAESDLPPLMMPTCTHRARPHPPPGPAIDRGQDASRGGCIIMVRALSLHKADRGRHACAHARTHARTHARGAHTCLACIRTPVASSSCAKDGMSSHTHTHSSAYRLVKSELRAQSTIICTVCLSHERACVQGSGC